MPAYWRSRCSKSAAMNGAWKKARRNRDRGRWNEAYELYAKACERAPAEPELWRERGGVALLLGDAEEACQCLFTSADMFARTASFDDAYEVITQVLELEPGRDDARSFERFLRRRVSAQRQLAAAAQRELAAAAQRVPVAAPPRDVVAERLLGSRRMPSASDVEEIEAVLEELDLEEELGASVYTESIPSELGGVAIDFRDPRGPRAHDDGASDDGAHDGDSGAYESVVVASYAPPGVPLARAQAVLSAVLEAGLLPSMRSDQMRCVFDLGRVIDLVAGTRVVAQPFEEHACLVVEGVVSIDRVAPGAKTLYSRGELFGDREVMCGAAMTSVSETAVVLAIPRDMLSDVEALASIAASTAA